MTKLLTLGTLFSTLVKTVVVAKLIILGILFLTSFILVLRKALVAELVLQGILLLALFVLSIRVVWVADLVVTGILYSIILILTLYTSFLTTSFLLHHLVCLNHQEHVWTYQ